MKNDFLSLLHTYLFNIKIIPILFILTPYFSFSQTDEIKFRHITREQGLTNSSVLAIQQDSKGFFWFGTKDGLNRYTGVKMMSYRTKIGDIHSLSNNFITCIYEDRSHNLWIGTVQGLNRYDEVKNKFIRYTHNPKIPTSISNDYITSISRILMVSYG